MIVELTVVYVGFGGNAGNGEYFYSYSPDIITVNQTNVNMQFVLSKATDKKRFVIENMVSTDANNQFQNPTVKNAGTELEVLNVNSNPQLTFIAVMVRDNDTNALVPCDPQVLNDPDL